MGYGRHLDERAGEKKKEQNALRAFGGYQATEAIMFAVRRPLRAQGLKENVQPRTSAFDPRPVRPLLIAAFRYLSTIETCAHKTISRNVNGADSAPIRSRFAALPLLRLESLDC